MSMLYKSAFRISITLGLLLIAFGCNSSPHREGESVTSPDYSGKTNWLKRPAPGSAHQSGVDVFFLLPTLPCSSTDSSTHTCAIDDSLMRKFAALSDSMQASAFDTVGDLYIPFYRQGNANYILQMNSNDRETFLNGIPATDVIAAFDEYITKNNDNRPFILAGHSQGSDILNILLKGYMKSHPDVYKRMVAAYVIGASVTREALADTNLHFATGPNDVGVIISYNTETPDFNGTNPLLVGHPVAINPINWSRDTTQATRAQSKGSRVMMNNVGLIDTTNFADAKLDTARGVVKCDIDPTKLASGSWPLGILHSNDYGLFYHDLEVNAKNRADLFIAKK